MSTVFQGRTFDRVPLWDPRNELYHVNALLIAKGKPTAYDLVQDKALVALTARVAALEVKPSPTPVPPTPVPPKPVSTVWDCPIRQDQQQTGMCVGYGWSNTAASQPFSEKIAISAGGDDEKATADLIYDGAQKADGSPADPATGASVLGGAKASQGLKLISAYHWATSVADVSAALQLGPVVLGIDWYDQMMSPDASGVIHVAGTVVGGHCIEVIGDDGTEFELQNSWGPGWGVNGRCFITHADLGTLLSSNGEACVPSR